MLRIFCLAIVLILSLNSYSASQTAIKIVRFQKKAGVIDRGEEDGIRVGEVYEVNRYDGDFVYWIGRVEIYAVKRKVAGVKLLSQADNASIQPGDVLERAKQEHDPLSEKRRPEGTPLPPRPQPPTLAGFSTGLVHPLRPSSQSFGLAVPIQIVDSDNDPIATIDLSKAYTTSAAFELFLSLPLASRFNLNLGYAFIPLNIKSAVAARLLNFGLDASASMIRLTGGLDYHWKERVLLGASVGVFFPQVTVKGASRSLTVSDRQLGLALNAAYLLPLTASVWLRPEAGYHFFMDQGPVIHYLTLKAGACFAIGKPAGSLQSK